MAKTHSRNPIGFTPWPVTFFTVAVYIAIFALLLITHNVVPSAPKSPTSRDWPGVNITEAWQDLKELSRNHHPYNSRANLGTRQWLLERIEDILNTNVGHDWEVVGGNRSAGSTPKSVTVFDDKTSNTTYHPGGEWAHYFEGDNIMVYIPGTEDDSSLWWVNSSQYEGPGGVMVNAHFDSVSTGYGATDDGVGVVTVLQLISHYSREENRPKKGLLALLNNGEEDGLYGAEAFVKHPMSKFPKAFLNLEGAGAGGRATLFRSTDSEVTKFYAKSPYPFGTVVSGDGFKRGLVRSGTDYSVFVDKLGMRGLDVAFMQPRARYHTSQDDARDTSVHSLWHMLSAALATTKALTDDTSDAFKASDEHHAGDGSLGVWFDLFGRTFAVLQLHALFGISVALLVAGPVILMILQTIIVKSGKWYPLSIKTYVHSSDDDEPVRLYGWSGFFRFPIAFVVSTAATLALAYLVTKVNPYIIYSSPYAVYSMMLGAWLSLTWFLMRSGDAVRPSALSRLFTLVWMYALFWVVLVGVTVSENNLHLGSGYFLVIYNAAVFVALLISYLELFALPKKSVYADQAYYGPVSHDDAPRRASIGTAEERPSTRDGPSSTAIDEDADERTSLLGSRQTFTRYGAHRQRNEDHDEDDRAASNDPVLSRVYESEQAWSATMPTWTWLLQFLVLGPINLILVGQLALFVTSALGQTPADGNPVLTIYIITALASICLMLPIAPFVHRLKYQVPTLIILIFIGTLIYNLVTFPFSRNARLKVYFIQRLDLDSGTNQVALAGLDGFVQRIAGQLPSTAGQVVECGPDVTDWSRRNGLSTCVWNGLTPDVVPGSYFHQHRKPAPYPNSTAASNTLAKSEAQKKSRMAEWISFSAKTSNSTDEVRLSLKGLNTRACRLYFDRPVRNVTVAGSGEVVAHHQDKDGDEIKGIRLWSRTWDAEFEVGVVPIRSQDGEEKKHGVLKGKAMCQWADINEVGTIPAVDEVKKFMPVWSIVSKGGDGLVEGYKDFEI